jgi:hypothetical protein
MLEVHPFPSTLMDVDKCRPNRRPRVLPRDLAELLPVAIAEITCQSSELGNANEFGYVSNWGGSA